MGWTMEKKRNSDSKLLNVTAGNRVCVDGTIRSQYTLSKICLIELHKVRLYILKIR